jgi:riboflavin synthase
MFTGWIQQMGQVAGRRGSRLAIQAPNLVSRLTIGHSVAVNGCCLTVMEIEGTNWWADLSEETLERTVLGSLQPGDPVNLEEPLRLDSLLHGHLVQGHVDGVAQVVQLEQLPGQRRLAIQLDPQWRPFCIEKGSIALDGVSLTIAQLEDDRLWVALIPHTCDQTTLGGKKIGSRVHVELDCIGKYICQLSKR